MGIVNVVDRRKRQYRFYTVNAVVEAAWHDNSVKDSDQIDDVRGPDYGEREHLELWRAIEWANGFDAPVTLYIYDEDGGIYPHKDSEITEQVEPPHKWQLSTKGNQK